MSAHAIASAAAVVERPRGHDGTRERWGAVGGFLAAAFYLWLAAWLVLFVLVPVVVLAWQPVVITSGSMEPLVRPGDAVLLQPPPPGDALAPGTVVAFDDPARPGTLTLHRIIGIHPDGSYRTKGDANAVPDSTPVAPHRIEGVARLLVPVVGLPAQWLRTAPALFALWLLVTLAACLVASKPPGEAGVARRRLPRPAVVQRMHGACLGLISRAAPRRDAVRVGRVWAPAGSPATASAAAIDAGSPLRRRRQRRLWREFAPPASALAVPPVLLPGRIGLLLAAVATASVLLLDPGGPEIPIGRWQVQLSRAARRALHAPTAWGAAARGIFTVLALALVLAPAGVRGVEANAALTATRTNAGNAWTAGDWGACLGSASSVLHAEADTFVVDDWDANFGSEPYVLVGTGVGTHARTLLRFPAPTVPSGCIVDRATLRLYATWATGSRTLVIHRLTSAFSETTVTWSSQPGVQGPPVHAASGTAGWVDVDVTGLATTMLDQGGHGFMLRDSNEDLSGEGVAYASRESGVAAQLVVHWR